MEYPRELFLMESCRELFVHVKLGVNTYTQTHIQTKKNIDKIHNSRKINEYIEKIL